MQPACVWLPVAAAIGVFSYSLYLTHELVIMQSWWFVIQGLPPMLNTLLIVTPATVGFAWLFYQILREAIHEEGRSEEPSAQTEDRPKNRTDVCSKYPDCSLTKPELAGSSAAVAEFRIAQICASGLLELTSELLTA